jgi:hypothetical protein
MKKLILVLAAAIISASGVQAAAPTPPSYELYFRPPTGSSDPTGDGGGTSAPYTYQEYYVGQTFALDIVMNTGGQAVTSGDVIINYDFDYLACSVQDGAIMDGYLSSFDAAAQMVYVTGWIVTPGKSYTGTGTFATLNCQVQKKREAMWSAYNLLPLNFYLLGLGASTDTNIGVSGGTDILAAVENGLIYLWPDTNKPFVNDFNPSNGAIGVSVTATPQFYFRDQNPISGDETGIVTNSLSATYQAVGGGSPASSNVTWDDCAGTWNNRNQCRGSIQPSTLIGGNRNFSYSQLYQICLQNGTDAASQLQVADGDPAPNVMDQTCYQFTTEADVDPPTVINHAPIGTNVPTNTNLSFTLRDVKQAAVNVYGTGVVASSLRVRVQGVKDGGGSVDVTLGCADAGVTCTPLGSALEQPNRFYAFEITLDPSYFAGGQNFNDFAQNSLVQVTVSDAQDYAGNTMTPFPWSFQTTDLTAPTIDNLYPAANLAYCLTEASSSAKVISFSVSDDGVGVAATGIRVRVGDDWYQKGGDNDTRLTLTGDANFWQVTLAPVSNLTGTTNPFAVEIEVTDQSGNTLVPSVLYGLVLDCDGGQILNPNVCEGDGFCNPICLNDPDCPGGTNCQPTPPPTTCPVATTCPTPNCNGGNYESCSSCCPSVSLPQAPYPQTIYRVREVCPVTGEEAISEASSQAQIAIVANQPYTFNQSREESSASCCRQWPGWPILVGLLAIANLHQNYSKRKYRHLTQALENKNDQT